MKGKGQQWYEECRRGGLTRREGRHASPPTKQCRAVWPARARGLGHSGGFHEPLPLTDAALQSDKVNAVVHTAVLTLPVQTLRHPALASILPDI